MIKIGAINIEVSHPKAFSEILNKGDRARYTTVFNDGFREMDEVMGFAKSNDLTVCSSLEEMADIVDIGFIHSCNWDRHLELAKPFIDKGKPVFIDKPIVGNTKDLKEYADMVNSGAVILGTSALRYCYEAQKVQKVFDEKNLPPVHSVVSVGVDEFNYAIHAVELICAIHRSRPLSCTHVSGNNRGKYPCNVYSVKFADGSTGEYIIIDGRFAMYNTIIMSDGDNQDNDFCFTVDNSLLYEAMLDCVCDYLEGGKNTLATWEETSDAIRIMLAGKASAENGDIEVGIDSPLLDNTYFDGYAFEKGYAAAASKMYLD